MCMTNVEAAPGAQCQVLSTAERVWPAESLRGLPFAQICTAIDLEHLPVTWRASVRKSTSSAMSRTSTRRPRGDRDLNDRSRSEAQNLRTHCQQVIRRQTATEISMARLVPGVVSVLISCQLPRALRAETTSGGPKLDGQWFEGRRNFSGCFAVVERCYGATGLRCLSMHSALRFVYLDMMDSERRARREQLVHI